MAGAVARKYGVRFYETLTGFKYICGKLRELEQTEPGVDYIYGFEESFGSSFGPYCRDKDGIAAFGWIPSRLTDWLALPPGVWAWKAAKYGRYLKNT